ncbi:hypothetical protein TNCT_214081 [Trichonephila clavata]|uniref:Uncharacterized protein n=1 Tax=Trichonephila clavata TaxID=2740835 RepID=A0A8X6KQY0_TRICU|nr:hypothetical protein TNCT_214081 [Trichonephila clavata]
MDSRYDSFDRPFPARVVPLPTNLVPPSASDLTHLLLKLHLFLTAETTLNSAHQTPPEPMTDPLALSNTVLNDQSEGRDHLVLGGELELADEEKFGSVTGGGRYCAC